MKFIGITGGVGAGKSQILTFIRDNYPAKVVLADDLAKELMAPGGACYESLRVSFAGDDVFREDGTLDQAKMARVLFSDEKKRTRMNNIVHPAVKREVLRQVAQEKKRGEFAYFFLEAALLIEEKYDEICDELWYIYTSEQIRRQRLKESREYSDEKINAIMASQLSEEMFRKACKVVIENNGLFDETCERLDDAIEKLGEI